MISVLGYVYWHLLTQISFPQAEEIKVATQLTGAVMPIKNVSIFF